LKLHGHFENAGPLWKGALWDKKLVNKMVKNNKVEENSKILNIIKKEADVGGIGFYDLHKIAKRYKVKIPKKDELIKKLKKKGYKASETHFSDVSVKSNIELKKLLELIQ